MNIRIDINNPIGEEKPELVGVWVEGFGWIMGSNRAGDLTIFGSIKVDTDDDRNRNASLRKRFLKRLRNRPFSDKNWRISR